MVRLQGKLKLTEKEKQCVYVNFHYIFQNYGVLDVSRFRWLNYPDA